MACRRSSDGLRQGQWGTVTGNLPFDKAGDDNSCNSNSTSTNNFFSIRVSRVAQEEPRGAHFLPHTSAYVSIRQHTSAYVSIRQQ
jgi:hypothetical protein